MRCDEEGDAVMMVKRKWSVVFFAVIRGVRERGELRERE